MTPPPKEFALEGFVSEDFLLVARHDLPEVCHLCLMTAAVVVPTVNSPQAFSASDILPFFLFLVI